MLTRHTSNQASLRPNPRPDPRRNPLTRLAILLIRAYQLILSPWVGQQCRFHPTCSHYTREALEKHGFLKGSALGLKRICRCHPWHEGGLDPVPEDASPLNRTL